MPDWTLSDIVKGTGGIFSRGIERPIQGFSIDSRTIKPNEVFIAIKGDRVDGHDFIHKAVQSGAAAVISERYPGDEPHSSDPPWIKVNDALKAMQSLALFHRERHPAKFIGVTGSNGKTTTKEMLLHIFSAVSQTWATSGNFNNHIGLPLGIIRIPLSTQTAIIEMGMNHAGEIRFLASIAKPDAALITNVGPAHIGLLGSLKNIALAKAEILEDLSPQGYAVLNGDDTFYSTMREKTQSRIVTFGLSEGNDFSGSDIRMSPRNIRLLVNHSGKKVALTLNLLGKHNALNAMASIAMFVSMGYSLEKAVETMESFQPVGARMEAHEIDGMRVILDCYNANPASMKQAVEFLAICEGRKIAVLGDMKELGDESEELHRKLGETVAASIPNQLITVGGHAQEIAQGAILHGMKPECVHCCSTTIEAARVLADLMSKGDTLLLKASRGMHFEAIVKELWPKLVCDLH